MTEERLWHLLARKFANEISLEELRELELGMKNLPSEEHRLAILSYYFDNIQSTKPNVGVDESWEKVRTAISIDQNTQKDTYNKPQKKRFIYTSLCTLVVLILGLGYYFDLFSSKQKSLQSNLISISSNTVGKKIILPDGSSILMNKYSNIRYSTNYGKSNRDVFLIGEAYFDVVKNEQLPMTVHTYLVNIKVKGTAFNVTAYTDDQKVETSLVRGLIELSTIRNPQNKMLLYPKQKMIIDNSVDRVATIDQKNQQKEIKKQFFYIDTLTEEPQSKIIPELAWMEDKLVFNAETLEDLIIKLNRRYSVNIQLENEALKTKRFTGAFDNEPIDEVLKAMSYIHPFDYQITKNNVLIKPKKL
ncbi:FecR family protein [Pedobacter borealis]|uniref:FecR family protein n=1 Tax=Pedobacter borealis TaxID=475254 RepID=UPI0004939ED6|nr:FecR family protein [Pedobacter borealis]